ncbi:NAD(P)/FAD-dependent oxidoreductase [Desulfobulbus alkaliphilus]|nr:NAD(P)/FAD-dependent oxidoreductase [Desulfobulbus alkaliphilus]
MGVRMPESSAQAPLVVAGGGAAGQAAFRGAEVILLEKKRCPGRKLRITGKGRRNLSNVLSLPDFTEHFGTTGPFFHHAFHYFSTPDLLEFFRTRGLDVISERGGRNFPASGKATDVQTVFESAARHAAQQHS